MTCMSELSVAEGTLEPVCLGVRHCVIVEAVFSCECFKTITALIRFFACKSTNKA